MEFGLPLLKSLLVQITSFVKLTVEMITPAIISIYTVLAPLIVGLFRFLLSIDYFGIIFSRGFALFIFLVVSYFLIYAYLSMYHPKTLKKIKDFLTLVPVPKPSSFLFKSSVDLEVRGR